MKELRDYFLERKTDRRQGAATKQEREIKPYIDKIVRDFFEALSLEPENELTKVATKHFQSVVAACIRDLKQENPIKFDSLRRYVRVKEELPEEFISEISGVVGLEQDTIANILRRLGLDSEDQQEVIARLLEAFPVTKGDVFRRTSTAVLTGLEKAQIPSHRIKSMLLFHSNFLRVEISEQEITNRADQLTGIFGSRKGAANLIASDPYYYLREDLKVIEEDLMKVSRVLDDYRLAQKAIISRPYIVHQDERTLNQHLSNLMGITGDADIAKCIASHDGYLLSMEQADLRTHFKMLSDLFGGRANARIIFTGCPAVLNFRPETIERKSIHIKSLVGDQHSTDLIMQFPRILCYKDETLSQKWEAFSKVVVSAGHEPSLIIRAFPELLWFAYYNIPKLTEKTLAGKGNHLDYARLFLSFSAYSTPSEQDNDRGFDDFNSNVSEAETSSLLDNEQMWDSIKKQLTPEVYAALTDFIHGNKKIENKEVQRALETLRKDPELMSLFEELWEAA